MYQPLVGECDMQTDGPPKAEKRDKEGMYEKNVSK